MELLQIATAFLLQIATQFITSCDRYYKLRWIYYKLRQVLQTAMDLLQIATGITKCHDYYKLRQYRVLVTRKRVTKKKHKNLPRQFIFEDIKHDES